MIGINKDINSFIRSSETITDIVGSKVYSVFAPEKTDAPFIVHWRSALGVNDSNSTYTELTAIIEVQAVSRTYSESIDLANEIVNTLHMKKYNGVNIELAGGSEVYDFEENLYIQSLSFNVY